MSGTQLHAAVLDHEQSTIDGKLRACEAELKKLKQKARTLAQELSDLKDSKTGRLRRRLYDRSDVLPFITQAYQQFKDDSALFNKSLKGFRLQRSVALRRDQPLSYRVTLQRPSLSSVRFFPIFDIPFERGILKLEISLKPGRPAIASIARADEIQEFVPVEFKLNHLDTPPGTEIELRLFAEDLDGPLRIFEWRRYSFMGLGPVRRLPFFALCF
jgi:hypothetical protein